MIHLVKKPLCEIHFKYKVATNPMLTKVTFFKIYNLQISIGVVTFALMKITYGLFLLGLYNNLPCSPNSHTIYGQTSVTPLDDTIMRTNSMRVPSKRQLTNQKNEVQKDKQKKMTSSDGFILYIEIQGLNDSMDPLQLQYYIFLMNTIV